MAHEIVDGSSMQRALTRITYEIIEHNKGVENLVFDGIKTRGVYLAERLAKRLNQLENVEIPVGALDITLYRDDRHIPDHHKVPTVKTSSLGIDINDKHVILNKEDYELYVTVSLLDNADYLKEDLFKIIDTLGTNLKRKFYQIMLSKLINSLNNSIKAKRSILAYDLQSKEDVEILLTKKKHCIFEVFKDTDHYKLADLELGTENLLI